MAELLYGIRKEDGKTITIWDVPIDQEGTKCNCICPACNTLLEACSLNGKVKRYFRHHSNTRKGVSNGSGNIKPSCSISKANETGLHKLAKELILKEKKIMTPAIIIPFEELDIKDIPTYILRTVPLYKYREAKVLECKNVTLEKGMMDFIPDVTINTEKGECIVEITVTNPTKTNLEKMRKIKGSNLPAIEIDLKNMRDLNISREELRTILLESIEDKEWINYPWIDMARSKAYEHYVNHPKVTAYLEQVKMERERAKKLRLLDEKEKGQQAVLQILKKIKEKKEIDKAFAIRRQKEIEIEQKKKYKEAEYEKARELVRSAFQPECYSRKLKSYETTLVREEVLNNFYFYKYKKNLPFFVNIPITGEIIFKCDRRVWQGAIFDKFIYRRKKNEHVIVKNIVSWFNKGYYKKEYRIYEDIIEEISDKYKYLEKVIEQYLEYMKWLGFISKTYATITTYSVTPPEKEYCLALEEALKNVELYSPEINELLAEKLKSFYDEYREKVRIEMFNE